MNDTRNAFGPLIGSIDEGTSSTRFLVFASKTAEVLTYHQIKVPHIIPKEGWFEQDPMIILEAVIETINVTCENLKKLNINYEDIVATGITNQRETTILWDPTTGKPLHNALIWMDMRTSSTVDEILQNGKRDINFLQNLCGLPVSTYFSALKIKWLMDNVKGIKEAMNDKRCLFGTVDSWLIWNLTGGVKGGLHVTDVTNASRTMLMNIETLKWDPHLCKIFDIPMHILPQIRSSSEIYGYITDVTALTGVPISGVLGDQQAALVGQMCFCRGQAKNTYGTGCFLLYNTGTTIVQSTHGLLTTVGYQLGPDKLPVYALEGSIAIAGIAIEWLKDNLGILNDAKDSGEIASSADEKGEAFFVPAFSGLYAPYWRKDARSIICGLTEETVPAHLVKASLEAVCYQVRDILEAMARDCGFSLSKLLVDGGMTANDFLMQLQADYCGIPVVRPTMTETTCLGAAIAAGSAKGVDVWDLENIQPVPSDTFLPSITDDQRDIKYDRWKAAIRRSLGWAQDDISRRGSGHAETKSHTRHPHTGSAHHRSIRADTRTNLSYEYSSNSPKPEFNQMYSKQNAKLMLECAVNINFSTSIWLKDGQIVQTILKDNTNNKRVVGHRFLVDASGNLFIDNVRLEDDGRWQCEAEDAFGFVVTGRPVQLTILDSPKKAYLMIDNRILDPGNPFIPVKENADLTVACVVDEGNPKPALSWELNLGSLALLDAPEVPLDVLNLTETIREQKVGARNDARLARVQRAHHNATLTCYVHHISLDLPLNVSVLLNVQYTPSFAISREPGFGFPIREGMPVSLKCDVDANPKALPIWQKDDSSPPVQQTPDGFLNFTEIKREHSGWYKCIARHRLGKFSSIGYFLNVRYDMEATQEPDFDIGELSSTGRQVEVALGGAVQLACPPGTTGCWTRVEAGTGRLEPMGASQELRLDKVLYQEAGEYRCVSPSRDLTRRLDSLRSALSVQLIVTGRPVVTPTNKTITAVYGQPLTLTMEFCANPPYTKVFWIAKSRVYAPGDADKTVIAYGITNSSEPNCHQAVLFLTKVTNADMGEYSFLVRSPNGLAEGNFHVNMTYASGYNVQEDVKSAAPPCRFAAVYVNVIVSLLMINCYSGLN